MHPSRSMGQRFLRTRPEDGDGGTVVDASGVSDMGGEYPDMRQIGFSCNVRCVALSPMMRSAALLHVVCWDALLCDNTFINVCLQAYCKAGDTVAKVERARARGQDLSGMISMNVNGICYDESSNSKSIFEMILTEIPEQARIDFRDILQAEYTPPTSLIFLLDRAEVQREFLQRLQDGRLVVRTFVAENSKSRIGAEGWPPLEAGGLWWMLLADIKKRAPAPRPFFLPASPPRHATTCLHASANAMCHCTPLTCHACIYHVYVLSSAL